MLWERQNEIVFDCVFVAMKLCSLVDVKTLSLWTGLQMISFYYYQYELRLVYFVLVLFLLLILHSPLSSVLEQKFNKSAFYLGC